MKYYYFFLMIDNYVIDNYVITTMKNITDDYTAISYEDLRLTTSLLKYLFIIDDSFLLEYNYINCLWIQMGLQQVWNHINLQKRRGGIVHTFS